MRDEDIPLFYAVLSAHERGKCLRGVQWQVQRKDSTVVPYSVWTAALRDGAGKFTGAIAVAIDVSDRKKAEALERDRNRVLELVATNRPSTEVLQSVEEMVERQLPARRCTVKIENETQPPPAATSVSAPILSFAGEKIGDVELSPAALDDGLPDHEIPDSTVGDLLNLASRLSSIGIEHQRIYSKLAFDARHDSLTGLPNRLAFEEDLNQRLARAGLSNHRIAVLYLDLDRFKQINDTLGHRIGDRYLEQVAKRLANASSAPELLFRLGGDEFVIVLPEVADTRAAETAASRLLELFVQPVQIGNHELFGTASIGISIFPDDASDAEGLKQHADSAMYRAKSSGRNRSQIFTPEMGQMACEELDIARGLHRALEEDRFVIHYQPKFARNGELAGAEALLRYRHPEKGLILPGHFIPTAEETGLIVPIGAWVLKEVCRQSMEWQGSGLQALRIAVNVSALQFGRADFAESVARIIEQVRICPELVELELTESALMDSSEESLRQMLRLRALGVRLSIDDFGHRLPPPSVTCIVCRSIN